MALYPSLEDMNVDLMQRAQAAVVHAAPQLQMASGNAVYPALGDFMGLELSPETIALNMPEYMQIVQSVCEYFPQCAFRSFKYLMYILFTGNCCPKSFWSRKCRRTTFRRLFGNEKSVCHPRNPSNSIMQRRRRKSRP